MIVGCRKAPFAAHSSLGRSVRQRTTKTEPLQYTAHGTHTYSLTSSKQHLSSLLSRRGDHALDLLSVRKGDHGTHRRRGRLGHTHNDRLLNPLDEASEELVIDRTLHEDARTAETHLASIGEGGTHGGLDRTIEIAVCLKPGERIKTRRFSPNADTSLFL